MISRALFYSIPAVTVRYTVHGLMTRCNGPHESILVGNPKGH